MPKTSPKAKPVTTTPSWWLHEGDEHCAHCGFTYVYELEFRCSECDGPGCPHCKVTHAEGRLVCMSCGGSAEGSTRKKSTQPADERGAPHG